MAKPKGTIHRTDVDGKLVGEPHEQREVKTGGRATSAEAAATADTGTRPGQSAVTAGGPGPTRSMAGQPQADARTGNPDGQPFGPSRVAPAGKTGPGVIWGKHADECAISPSKKP